MTYAEAEEFIETVISPGEVMDVLEIRNKYRYKILQEALADYSFRMAVTDMSRMPDHMKHRIPSEEETAAEETDETL